MAQRIAYVTGGMGGIGTAICKQLARPAYGGLRLRPQRPARIAGSAR
jgi:NAD(P)-dependent dehydrogenase (short-subunit alcohol dehydrogenase family)